VELEPAVSLRAEVLSAELNGRPVAFRAEGNGNDQHVAVKFGVYGGPNTLRIHVRNDFGVSYAAKLPPLGSRSEGLRFLNQDWNGPQDELTLQLEGAPEKSYELSVWNAGQLISAEGAEIVNTAQGRTKLRVSFPAGGGSSLVKQTVVLHLAAKAGKGKTKKH
jgi:hypothetical protein